MKQSITFIIIVGLLITSSSILAEISSNLMMRFSQTLKFEAQKVESFDFASRKGRFQKVQPEKIAVTEKMGDEDTLDSSKPESNSFSIASDFIAAKNAYKLTIIDATGGGVLISDQPMDQAPTEGYISKAECQLKLADKAYDAKKYVYLKTKSSDKTIPYQYSRLELNMTVGKAKLIMDVNAVTNPDGTGNLKYDAKALRKQIAQRRAELQAAMKSKTATDEQMEELQELELLQMQDRQSNHNRWDFDGNRRRLMQQKRQRHLEADGRIKPKKRTIKKEKSKAALK